MCGRYANHVKEMTGWTEILGDWPAGAALSMNIAPSQSVPVVVGGVPRPHTEMMRWGLVPAWSKTARPKYSTFNARVESVGSKPAFRGAFARQQTCLVPASGYYEWTGEKGHKLKHYIHFEDESPLLMAGLWDRWGEDEERFYSCTILTRSAVSRISEIHPRMPLILPREDALDWLQQPPQASLKKLLSYRDYALSVSTPPPG